MKEDIESIIYPHLTHIHIHAPKTIHALIANKMIRSEFTCISASIKKTMAPITAKYSYQLAFFPIY